MLNTGDTVKGRYSIVRTIGGGAYGTVYLVSGGYGKVYLVSDSSSEGYRLVIKEMVEVDIPTGERYQSVRMLEKD